MKYLIVGLIVICAFLLVELMRLVIRRPKAKMVGCIRINTSDPEKDVYSLELDVPFGELERHSKVIFTIEKD